MNTSSDKTLSRKEREFLARRKEILDAATRLFAKNGYHGTTMSEIAREAEFSTGSLYNFFENKEELYFSLMRDKIEALEEELDKIYTTEEGVEESLKSFISTILDYFERERDFFAIFAEQRETFQRSSKGELGDIINDKYERYLGNMAGLMSRGVEEGIFKPLNPAELALIFLGIVNTFLFVYINAGEKESLQDKSGTILEVFFNGTRKNS